MPEMERGVPIAYFPEKVSVAPILRHGEKAIAGMEMKVMKITFRDVAGITRLPFLALTPLCVAVGASVAWWKTGNLDWGRLMLALLGGMAAHVSVNALNEYQDFRSGLDLRTEKTPFSGGSGTLPARPELASLALRIGIGGLIVTALVGLWFVWQVGPGILWVGVPGLLLVAG